MQNEQHWLLEDKTVERIGKLIGRKPFPSPSSVAQVPASSSANEQGDHDFKVKVNQLVSHFMNEILRIAVIHQQHCCSMRITPTDVNYAIEKFAKDSIRGPSLYIQVDPSNGDEEGLGSNWSEQITSDIERVSSDEMDCDLDHDYHKQIDESDNECEMECEEKEEPWITRPKVYPTPLFDTVFPHLTEHNEYFKLSDDQFVSIVSSNTSYYIEFHENSQKPFKDAMLRFITVECLKS